MKYAYDRVPWREVSQMHRGRVCRACVVATAPRARYANAMLKPKRVWEGTAMVAESHAPRDTTPKGAALGTQCEEWRRACLHAHLRRYPSTLHQRDSEQRERTDA